MERLTKSVLDSKVSKLDVFIGVLFLVCSQSAYYSSDKVGASQSFLLSLCDCHCDWQLFLKFTVVLTKQNVSFFPAAGAWVTGTVYKWENVIQREYFETFDSFLYIFFDLFSSLPSLALTAQSLMSSELPRTLK